MTLTASEQRALASIEARIQSRDPRLRSLFAIFSRLTGHEAMPSREKIPRRRRPRAALAFPIGFMLIAAIIVVGSLRAAGRPCIPIATTGGSASRGVSVANPRAVSAAGLLGRHCPPGSGSGSATP